MEIERDFIFDPSLVLYLPLYRLDGASFISKDAYGHLCTVTGAVWRPNGHYFDGIDDEISLPSAIYQGLASTDDFTVIIWFYFDGTTPAATEQIFGMVADSAQNKPHVTISINTSNKITADVRQTADTTTNAVTSASGIVAGWHYAVLRHDSSDTNKVYLDLDGVSEGSDNTNSLTFTGSDFYEGHLGAMGPNGAGWDGFYSGMIGEFLMYKRFLTNVETENIRLATKWRYR